MVKKNKTMPFFDVPMFFNQLFWTVISLSICFHVVEHKLIDFIHGKWFSRCISLKKLELKSAVIDMLYIKYKYPF